MVTLVTLVTVVTLVTQTTLMSISQFLQAKFNILVNEHNYSSCVCYISATYGPPLSADHYMFYVVAHFVVAATASFCLH